MLNSRRSCINLESYCVLTPPTSLRGVNYLILPPLTLSLSLSLTLSTLGSEARIGKMPGAVEDPTGESILLLDHALPCI
jgi:hypothetical protein